MTEGSFLIFAGRRWRVVDVDPERRVIDLLPAGGGRVPVFDSASRGAVHDRVRREMFSIYTGDTIPVYLDALAADLLHEGRENFLRYGLDRTNFLRCGDGAFYFPWLGDVAMNTLMQQLQARSLAVSLEGPAVVAQRIEPAALRSRRLTPTPAAPVTPNGA